MNPIIIIQKWLNLFFNHLLFKNILLIIIIYFAMDQTTRVRLTLKLNNTHIVSESTPKLPTEFILGKFYLPRVFFSINKI